ncbi:MAG: 6-carboxytetrahydropterin synthase [Bacteroidales bacterium]|nr:6-carboxytetrahydropterin synthase [Bacteroidales bacterium]
MNDQAIIRITKQFHFEAAHALWNYDGPCKNIHGHSYVLYVTIKGRPLHEPGHPKNGMLMDFSILKKIVNELIIEPYDHALLVNAGTAHADMAREGNMFGKIAVVPYQPTCENMVCDFAGKIKNALPPNISLHALRLHETATAYAEWTADDN